MPFNEVMKKFKGGSLTSGSKSGPPVKNRKQAIAIMLSEKKKAMGGDTEYQPTSKAKVNTKPTNKFMARFGKMK